MKFWIIKIICQNLRLVKTQQEQTIFTRLIKEVDEQELDL